MIVDFDYDREKTKENVIAKLKAKHPEYNYAIIDDYDTSDLNLPSLRGRGFSGCKSLYES